MCDDIIPILTTLTTCTFILSISLPLYNSSANKAKLQLDNLQKKASARQEESDSQAGEDERGIDALTIALGKKDHRGHVKGLGRCGVGISHSQAFGKQHRKTKKTNQGGCSMDELEAMKASLTQEFEAKLEEKLQERLSQRVAEEVQAYLNSLQVTQMSPNPTLPMNKELELHSDQGKGLRVIEVTQMSPFFESPLLLRLCLEFR